MDFYTASFVPSTAYYLEEDSYQSQSIEIKSLFKPLSYLLFKFILQMQTAHSNDGHVSYFAEAPCILAPQCWSSPAYS